MFTTGKGLSQVVSAIVAALRKGTPFFHLRSSLAAECEHGLGFAQDSVLKPHCATQCQSLFNSSGHRRFGFGGNSVVG